VITVTVRRLLTERKHIALLGAVAMLAVPASASAAGHEHLQPRVRLRADAPNVASAVGIGNAEAVSGPLLDPVDRYSGLIATTAARAEHRQKVQARERREAREERQRFAQLPGGVSMATLESIAACESGGNPEAVSPEGTYRGKYQFDQGTWESVGGHGDPAQAPEAEQDYRAALLYSESGSSPWPVCG
jgi:TolA-binding protein